MSLRKSPVGTAALLAACRANARKSTGPRTAAGKARSRLNSLRHGRSCRKLHRCLPEGLSLRDRVTYQWIQHMIETCFPPGTAGERDRALRLAVEVWCQVVGAVGRSVSGNLAENRRVRKKYFLFLSPSRFRITVPHSKQSLPFGTQAVPGVIAAGGGDVDGATDPKIESVQPPAKIQLFTAAARVMTAGDASSPVLR